MRHHFHFKLWPLLLGAFLLLTPSPADAQNRGKKRTTTARRSGTGRTTLKAPATPTPIGDTERTIQDLLYFPFSCLNAYMPTREIAQQEVMDTFGACENINGCPGLHTNDSFDFTYRCVPIGMCYYDWYDNRTWYHFYFETKAEADKFYNQLVADVRSAGISLTRDKVYGDISNRSHPVSVFKWVNVAPPELVKAADPSNIDTHNVVGMYMVEFGVMKKKN
ncbi:MAG: hypothetical protein IKQ77_10820 [Prevotella sp.]|nr:hypothetical protein [Prevotella sp.]